MLKMDFLKKNKLLFFILGLALVLRFIGIRHGFPFIFHPDTPTIVRSALAVRFFPNPKHFDWPHLYIYLNYFIYMGFAVFRKVLEFGGLQSFVSSFLPMIWTEPFVFYFITRILTALFGAFTVIPVYLAGKELFNKKIGLIAALAIAIFPFHVWHSHYGLTDVPMTFFVAWALYFGVRLINSDEIRLYLLAGFFVGLAASTKYNGGLSALVVVLVYFGKYLFSKDFKRAFENIWKPVSSAVAALFGFLLGTPFALLDWKTFSRTDGPKGAFWQFTNVGSVSFTEQVNQFLSAMTSKFIEDWSSVFVFLFLFGLFYAGYLIVSRKIKSKEKILGLIVIFIPAFIFLFYISGFSKNRSHYYMVAYPFIVLGIGWFWNELEQTFSKKLGLAFFLIIFSVPLFISSKYAFMYARKDTRVLLQDWYEDNRSRLKENNYKIHYSTSNFEELLPEDASKEEKIVDENTPYLYINECEGASLDAKSDGVPFGVFHYINNNLRRGPTICIYDSLAE